MERIVTLPITPVEGRTFLSLFTPLVADIFSRLFCRGLTIMVNTVGYKTEGDGDALFEKYRQLLAGISIVDRDEYFFTHDGQGEYQIFFVEAVKKLLAEGVVKSRVENTAWCQCGRVGLPQVVVDNLLLEKRKKTLITMIGGKVACSQCLGLLDTDLVKNYFIELPNPSNFTIEPQIYTSEIQAIMDRNTSRPLIVSRVNRAIKQAIVSDICFDIDFRWMFYPGYLLQLGFDKLTVITSPTTLNQTMKMLSLCSIVYPDVKFHIIIHPLVRICDERTVISKMSVGEYLVHVGSAAVARSFLSLGLQWTQYETTVRSSELHLIRQTCEMLGRLNWHDKKLSVAGKYPDRGEILKSYKNLRGGKLTDEEKLLISSVNGI